MNIQKMMQQAQAMQTKVQAELDALRVEGLAGGGMVTDRDVRRKEVLSVKIDQAAVDPADVETLQDLVLAAPSRRLAAAWTRRSRRRPPSMLGGMMPGMR